MRVALEQVKTLLDDCSDEDLKALRLYIGKLVPHPLENDWRIDADTVLSAIERSSDLTKRGVRGIIAEAVFIRDIASTVAGFGWQLKEVDGDRPYDAMLQKGDLCAKVQVKLQRLEARQPKLYYPRHYERGSLFVVEVQKTRTGVRTQKRTIAGGGAPEVTTESITVKTRPYSFGDFDILAVNMQPSSGNWKDFRFTVASWLLPRQTNEKLIEIFQPVAAVPNDVWTEDLGRCLSWLENGKQARILDQLLHLKKSGRK